jgi:hypothetical protein
MAEQDEQIVTRAPHALVERLDAFVERLKAEEPGRRVTRADAIRILLHKALDAEEGPKATKTTKAKR